MQKLLLFTTLLSLALLCLNHKAISQNSGFGIKAGANLSILNGQIYTGPPSKGASFKIGPNAGIFGFFRPSNHFAIQPEFIYSAQGCKNEWSYGKSITTLNYLNLPLIFKLYINNKFNWQLGPQLGLLLSAKEKGTIYQRTSNGTKSVPFDQSTTNNFESTDFSIVTGFGINITPEITFTARFNYEIGNIDAISANNYFRSYKPLNNRVFQFSIGYNFGGDYQPNGSLEED